MGSGYNKCLKFCDFLWCRYWLLPWIVVDCRSEWKEKVFFFDLKRVVPVRVCLWEANINHKWRWKLCALRSHWHVRNVNSGITTWQKRRKTIPTGWRRKSIVGSARPIQCIRKPSNPVWKGKWLYGEKEERSRRETRYRRMVQKSGGRVQKDYLAGSDIADQTVCGCHSFSSQLGISDCIAGRNYQIWFWIYY